MQGKITIEATEHDQTHSDVNVFCDMVTSNVIDRFNLVNSVAQALEFDEKDWLAFYVFRKMKGKIQTEKSTTVDLRGIRKQEE